MNAMTAKQAMSDTCEWAEGHCSLGHVLVARTRMGLCAVLLGDDQAALQEDLRSRFGGVHWQQSEHMQGWLSQVVHHIEHPHLPLDLPLDATGSAFQRKVWSALQGIAAGQTASYADIAQMIGSPSSVRAVAGACAANPLAVVVPCHRVIRRDGGLSGYRWGLARKQALLAREGLQAVGS
jgi:AraC family transcriptional regulator of adaptative response/methylated-DNA-[protein]-cysteine methyltransferase